MLSLKLEIEKFQKEMMANTPELLEKLQKSKENIILNNAEDQSENLVLSDELLKNGPLVITFYRGGWCPYCNLELRSLQSHLDEIKENGANLVAISPEQPDNSLDVSEKNNLKFPVLSDSGNTVARKFGLVFELPAEIDKLYKNELKLDLAAINSTDKPELPIPATYVIGKDRKIKYAFVNLDYTQRAEPNEIIDVLKKL